VLHNTLEFTKQSEKNQYLSLLYHVSFYHYKSIYFNKETLVGSLLYIWVFVYQFLV